MIDVLDAPASSLNMAAAKKHNWDRIRLYDAIARRLKALRNLEDTPMSKNKMDMIDNINNTSNKLFGDFGDPNKKIVKKLNRAAIKNTISNGVITGDLDLFPSAANKIIQPFKNITSNLLEG